MEFTAEKIQEHIDKFTPFYDKDGKNTMPKDKKLTVWCEAETMSDSGFAENVFFNELGLAALIAKSWILQSELEALILTKEK